jgi:hypothetical protein
VPSAVYVAPGEVQTAGTLGSFQLAIDPRHLPTPGGFVAALPGEAWYFQAWHRDTNPGVTSNFTAASS